MHINKIIAGSAALLLIVGCGRNSDNPAAGGTAEAAKAAPPKRKSGKAITGELETLDVSQAPESEAASNGNGKHPFRQRR